MTDTVVLIGADCVYNYDVSTVEETFKYVESRLRKQVPKLKPVVVLSARTGIKVLNPELQSKDYKRIIKMVKNLLGDYKKKQKRKEKSNFTANWGTACCVCGAVPTVEQTELCGPCCFGESATVGGGW